MSECTYLSRLGRAALLCIDNMPGPAKDQIVGHRVVAGLLGDLQRGAHGALGLQLRPGLDDGLDRLEQALAGRDMQRLKTLRGRGQRMQD